MLLGPPMFFAVPRPGGPNGAAELDVAAFAGAVRSQGAAGQAGKARRGAPPDLRRTHLK